MESNRQLLDSLTSHISLYNSHNPSSPNPNPNPRSQILKWFNSLTPRQRQSHLTIVDKSFTQLLIQLQSKLTTNGHGSFIVLPDIPSSNANIPSFCFRKAHGLLTRITNLEKGQVGFQRIGESVKLFASGENLDNSCLDSVTVSSEFVGNVDRFVEAMDAVSNGEFLRGEESVFLDWVELGWLKEKGYYSVDAFVANRLEVALRLSWMNLNVGKKRGVKVKERAVCEVAGVAANVYWRKMGCVDWWMKLDDVTKKKVFRTVLGKAAKSLTHDILYGRSSGMEDELQTTQQPLKYSHPSWHQEPIDTFKGKDFESGTTLFIPPSNKFSSISHKFNQLLVVCEISKLLLAFDHGQLNEEALFFSSLEGISTVSDRVLRRLRGLLMGVSLEFTKLELLEDLNSTKVTKPVKKSKPKPKPKKGKSRDVKKPVSVQICEKSSSASDKPTKDEGDKLDIQDMDYKRDESASTSLDEVINPPLQTTSKKNKRARKKHKKDGMISQTTPVKVSVPPDTTSVDNNANPKEMETHSLQQNNTESQHVDPIVHEHVTETEMQPFTQNPVLVHEGGPVTFPTNPPQLSFVHQSGFVHALGLCREDDFVSGSDYSQYFGGGVMYWDSYDHPVAATFSRPPSLSSDDSSWAWQEADMNRTVDDMVAFSSSYSTTTGLTSPSATSYTMKDLSEETVVSSFPDNIETKTGDLFPYPILRPIIIPSINRSREFKRNFEHKSPCVPPSRREVKIKRPPSPVVLCVPPVSDSRKQRGFPTVRSGSSSPRQWGVKGWFHGDKKSLSVSARQLNGQLNAQLSQTLPGALLQDRLIAISQLTRDQDSHPDLSIPLQSCDKPSLLAMHALLNDEIDSFCKRVAGVNMTRKPYINWAVKRVTRSLQVLWPRSRTNVFGSNATGLSLPTSDVDLVVCLPPVRNLEPIKEAGILEGRNGIKETCLQHAARYLANQEWVKSDSLKIVENTAIPIIMLVVDVPCDVIVCTRGDDVVVVDDALSQLIRIDISFKSPSHTGLQTTELVKNLTEQFPAATPLALVLKQFLADRSLDQSYSGGLSSYCLILLITRFLQHEHHYGRSIGQNFGGLLMDFFYFFGNVFDPRRMRVSVQGSGVYIDRERGYSIDPIYIDDPLFPANNVGRNCFRIHQCIKAFADAYSTLEDQLDSCDNGAVAVKLLPLIIPSIAPV